jgi:hypothetical protein
MLITKSTNFKEDYTKLTNTLEEHGKSLNLKLVITAS